MKKENCIHWTGIQKDCCKIGINYRQLAGAESGMALRLPCWVSSMPHAMNFTKVSCDKFTAPTDAQIAADEAENVAFDERVRKVMPVVAEWRKKEPRGRQEVINCPACGGRLHLAQSAYNGHVQGKCETPGCIQWME